MINKSLERWIPSHWKLQENMTKRGEDGGDDEILVHIWLRRGRRRWSCTATTRQKPNAAASRRIRGPALLQRTAPLRQLLVSSAERSRRKIVEAGGRIDGLRGHLATSPFETSVTLSEYEFLVHPIKDQTSNSLSIFSASSASLRKISIIVEVHSNLEVFSRR
jgi:hypothetical protein